MAQANADLSQPHEDHRVCIIGQGYVGVTLAVALCEAGRRVHGVERNAAILESLRGGRAHFLEEGLDDTLAPHVAAGRFTVSSSLPPSDEPTVYIVTVGTPLTPGRKANLQALKEVIDSVAAVLKPQDMVLLRSTVRVGVSRELVQSTLDQVGVDYDLAFCPERTAEGKALAELKTLPQIVGGISDRSALRAKTFFQCVSPEVLIVSSIEAAELIKLVNNTQRDYMFAFANEIAGLCEAMQLSAGEVLEVAARNYPRAIPMQPGLVGGPCLEKDPHILAESAAMFGAEARLALQARKANEDLPARTVAKIAAWFDARGTRPKVIAILGLAFKGRPATSDLRGSLVVPLIAELRARFPGTAIRGYDPCVFDGDAATLQIETHGDMAGAVSGADLVLLQTNHAIFQATGALEISRHMAREGLIYDYWRQFPAPGLTCVDGITLSSLGSWT